MTTEPNDSNQNPTDFDRTETISKILEIQKKIAHRNRSKHHKKAILSWINSYIKRLIIYTFIGRRLSKSLSTLTRAVAARKRPYLGSELAEVLEAASRKVMGYKRWLITLGMMAALPGFVSVFLLWQQYESVKLSKTNKIEDLRNNNRVELLITIYQTSDKSESGMLTTPIFSASNRRNAVFELIAWDGQRLAETKPSDDIRRINRMVDISVAPLNDVDFTPMPGEQAFHFEDISFVNSSFTDSDFQGCHFTHVWFSNAQLYGTNFRHCRFKDVSFEDSRIIGADFRAAQFVACDFEGALYDATTLWPDSFDPIAAGSIPMETEHE